MPEEVLKEEKVTEEYIPDPSLPRLEDQFGGGWCNCIQKVIQHLTPTKLAVYCEQKGYKAQPPAVEDETGTRYSYFLQTVNAVRVVGTEEQSKTFNLVAAFGDFRFRSVESRKTTLEAIWNIARHERRSPQEVAAEVIKCDESKKPPVRKMSIEDRSATPPVPPVRMRTVL